MLLLSKMSDEMTCVDHVRFLMKAFSSLALQSNTIVSSANLMMVLELFLATQLCMYREYSRVLSTQPWGIPIYYFCLWWMAQQDCHVISTHQIQQLLFTQPRHMKWHLSADLAPRSHSSCSRHTQHLQNKTSNVKDKLHVLYNSSTTVCDVCNCI